MGRKIRGVFYLVDQGGKKPTVIASKDDIKDKAPRVVRKREDIEQWRGVKPIEPFLERKERARETIAFILVFGFLALLISSFLFAGTVDEAIKLIQSISASLSGMIGAILGYYYGTTRAETPTTTSTP